MPPEEHEFSLARYRRILRAGLDAGYAFRRFHEPAHGRTVYLRHDVDNSLHDALTIARIEAEHGVRSTYMVLLRSQNYNALAGVSVRAIRSLAELGHTVGLHFSREPDDAVHEALPLAARIALDAKVLGEATGLSITQFSFHNPTGKRDFQVQVPGLLNAYAPPFFERIKYLSESNFRWRDGCPSRLLAEGTYEKLQILIHPMTYCDRLADDRDALLYFLWRKVRELRDVNQAQNATLSAPGGGVPMADVARYLAARGDGGA